MQERRKQYISTTTLVILFISFLLLAGMQYVSNAQLNVALQEVMQMRAEIQLIEAQQKQVQKLYEEVNQIREYIQLHRPQATDREAWETAAYLVHFSKKHSVDPRVVVAMAYQESRFNRYAVGGAGERGMLQVLPSTFRTLSRGGLDDWRATLEAGVRYYKYLERRYAGNVTLAVAAYNAGPGRVANQIPEITSTQRYVARVMLAYRGLHGGRR